MKKQITIYYNKNKKFPNDYIIKRVFIEEENFYSLSAYYMINNKIKEFKSSLKWSNEKINQYIIQCMKSECFDHIEYQKVMEEFKK